MDEYEELDFRSQPSNWRVIAGIGTIFLAAFLLAVVLVFWTVTAHAQAAPYPACRPFKTIQAELKQHKEVEIAGGIAGETQALIIFGTPDGSTWTAVALGTTGTACIIASGTGWFQSNLLSGRPV